jgi:cupin 2 domain-containing protein
MSDSNSLIPGNLFAALPALHAGEVFEEILRCRNVRVERIVSSARPAPSLYDQPQDEWVCLLQGEAELWVAGQAIHLKPGDHYFIPAHTPHRVVRTSPEPPCIWLAVHIDPGGAICATSAR